MNNSSTHFTSYHISTPPKTLKQVQGDELRSECNKLKHPQPVIASVSVAIQKRKSLKQTKKAFTLAKIMIVLMVIGITTAILLPSARNAMPNEKVMKFKRGHNALHVTIRELVSSDKYYLGGDLGVKQDGTRLNKKEDSYYKYFCQTFADVINAKQVNCLSSDEFRNSSL